MSKVKIKLKLNDLEESIMGILNGNQLKFLLNKKVVTLKLNDNNIVMKRYENEEEYTYLDFNQTNPIAYYYFHQKFPLNMKVNQLKIENNKIQIHYLVEGQEFLFKIEYEEGEL